VSADFLVQDNGARDEVAPEAAQHSLETLPVETLLYLLGSRYGMAQIEGPCSKKL